jgi:thymidylate kinase
MRTASIVEFAGLPGAGKTTIARAALFELEELGLRCFCNESLVNHTAVRRPKSRHISGKFRTLLRFTFSGLRYRRVAVELFRCMAHTRSLSPASLNRAAGLLILLGRVRSAPDGRYDLVLLDQGLIQYIWSIFVTGELPSDRDLHRLLAAILEEVSLAVIFVDIGIDTAAQRIRERETMSSRFDEFSTPRVQEYLSRNTIVFEKIRCWISELSRAASLDVDGSRPVNRNVRRIVPFIASLPQAGRRVGANS